MKQLTVKTKVKSTSDKVWTLWTDPVHIKVWNTPSEDWHTTKAENDLRVGGRFLSRMEAKDGSFGFDFSGTYDIVARPNRIAYTLEDGRKAVTDFHDLDGQIEIITVFDAEDQNPIEMQRDGWQAILENFKAYAEHPHSI